MMTETMTDSKTETFNVLIADDREFFRNWLSEQLKKLYPSIQMIYEAEEPRSAISKAGSLKPDLIFMDIDFEKDRSINGVQAAGEIWKTNPEAAIIVISSYDAIAYVKQLYDCAPDDAVYGYVLKDNVVRDLKTAVDSMLNKEGHIDPNLSSTVTKLRRKDVQVTDGQFEVLVYIALGLSDKTISKLTFLTPQAVQARLRSLYARFNIPSKNAPDAGTYNSRCKAVWHGLKSGIITEPEMERLATQVLQEAQKCGITLTV
ncbi:response regulator transcription factor [Candidatus Obscuribacterales bacterium]|nr:response regulator transcription factor [Candidatus Obscuribacterales bacterium]